MKAEATVLSPRFCGQCSDCSDQELERKIAEQVSPRAPVAA
jgi:hypothetical protein